MTTGTVRNNFLTDLSVVVSLNDILFTHADFINFRFINRINEAPSGFIRIIDRNSEFMKTASSEYGSMIFTNTTDNDTQKISGLNFKTTEMMNEKVEGPNSVHYISWIAGGPSQIKKASYAYVGNSVKVMEQIFEKGEVNNNIKFPTDISPPTDDMKWLTIQDNMWEQLNSVVSKSYRKNDYIFWAWDDVNGTYKISSFDVEKRTTDKYIFIESDNAVSSTDSAKGVSKDGDFTIWQYNKVIKMNRLGIDYGKLFPNVSFSGLVEGDLKSTGFKQSSFVEVLKREGDSKIEELIAYEKNSDITYGDLAVKRHWPNNIHKMYSFADVYREYKLATYAKRVSLQIYNNVGPPLGSKVMFLKMGDDYRIGNLTMDETFTDIYIVIEKMIEYNITAPAYSDSLTPSTSNFITTITLASDNFAPTNETGKEQAEKIASNANLN